MCIRDSAGAVPVPRRTALRTRRDRGLAARDADRLHRHAACLLYTSDAADDLLCVDLGGRRIIKKKKRYKNQRVPTSH